MRSVWKRSVLKRLWYRLINRSLTVCIRMPRIMKALSKYYAIKYSVKWRRLITVTQEWYIWGNPSAWILTNFGWVIHILLPSCFALFSGIKYFPVWFITFTVFQCLQCSHLKSETSGCSLLSVLHSFCLTVGFFTPNSLSTVLQLQSQMKKQVQR